jgi:outer membrane protein OmpA-like peptidoglycan-associated protein
MFQSPVKLLPLLFVLLLYGCSSTPPTTQVVQTPNEELIEDIKLYDLEADEIDLGVKIYLPKLSFKFDSFDLSNVARDKLAYIVQLCQEESALNRNVLVMGHADSKGTTEYNLQLSRERAITVKDTLLELGLQSSRVTAAWYGANQPIVPNQFSDGRDNPEGRAVNRRVEVVILNP